MNRSTELERIASGCKYDLFDYTLCEVELYVEIATWRDEHNDNRIFTKTSQSH